MSCREQAMDFIVDLFMFILLNLLKPRLGVREATNYEVFNRSSHHLSRGMNFWPHFSQGKKREIT